AGVADRACGGRAFGVCAGWIETEFSAGLEPQETPPAPPESPAERRSRLTVEVGGKRLEVTVPAVFGVSGATASSSYSPERAVPTRSSSRRSRSGSGGGTAAGGPPPTPTQGGIVKIVAEGGVPRSARDAVGG